MTKSEAINNAVMDVSMATLLPMSTRQEIIMILGDIEMELDENGLLDGEE